MRELYVFESMEVELNVTKDYPSLIYLDGKFWCDKSTSNSQSKNWTGDFQE